MRMLIESLPQKPFDTYFQLHLGVTVTTCGYNKYDMICTAIAIQSFKFSTLLDELQDANIFSRESFTCIGDLTRLTVKSVDG